MIIRPVVTSIGSALQYVSTVDFANTAGRIRDSGGLFRFAFGVFGLAFDALDGRLPDGREDLPLVTGADTDEGEVGVSGLEVGATLLSVVDATEVLVGGGTTALTSRTGEVSGPALTSRLGETPGVSVKPGRPRAVTEGLPSSVSGVLLVVFGFWL
jgi:hypothetical protein